MRYCAMKTQSHDKSDNRILWDKNKGLYATIHNKNVTQYWLSRLRKYNIGDLVSRGPFTCINMD